MTAFSESHNEEFCTLLTDVIFPILFCRSQQKGIRIFFILRRGMNSFKAAFLDGNIRNRKALRTKFTSRFVPVKRPNVLQLVRATHEITKRDFLQNNNRPKIYYEQKNKSRANLTLKRNISIRSAHTFKSHFLK
jgi:hypothetical protein